MIAKHPEGYLDVGEILATGDYTAASRHWPSDNGTPTAASAFANGAFFMQMAAATADGGSAMSIVACTLPGGEVTSAPLDDGYTIETMEFDQVPAAAVLP